MQIISLPDHWTIVLSFVLWFVIQYSAALYCLRIPDDKLSSSSGLFRSYRFEDNGRIYDKNLPDQPVEAFIAGWKRHIQTRKIQKEAFS